MSLSAISDSSYSSRVSIMESDFAELSINEEEDEVLQIQWETDLERERGFFQLVGCFLTASVIYFPAMKSTIANLWHPVRGVQIRDLGEKSDSFCEAKMALGVEVAEMGCDITLWAQSRRALTMKSVWLREEGEEVWGENQEGPPMSGNNLGIPDTILGVRSNIDPILRINLEGRRYKSRIQ
ncbi:hypothetical protein PVK06_005768 [Gossypium arboreum]|uniref:Uncharacterized protein n=1 Tax=Gossypium arboreum TaxID=29729 RepID=A0ABR0QVE3_GOSAR|nr:hypothetical protein PVK06_005768 [Gossypium arboreum]